MSEPVSTVPMPNSRVILVNMPWTVLQEPGLGLGILSSVLRTAQIPVETVDAHLYMLRWLKYDTYTEVANLFGVNDWIFTGELDSGTVESEADDLESVLVRVAQYGEEKRAELREKLLRIRREVVPSFLDTVLDTIDFSDVALVGFTCLYDQTFSALALAARIREKHPDIMIAFGGYALQAPVGPELQSAFSEMDVIAYGDGEPTIVPLYRAACGQCGLDSVPNISYRTESGEIRFTPARQCDIDTSPAPNYDDFVASVRRLKAEDKVELTGSQLPFESSRGCWWGQKNHCKFCGIDEETLRYRVKNPGTVIRQLDELHDRYGALSFRASDYIFPHSFHGEFVSALTVRGAPYRLHYEMKSNLTADMVDGLYSAGFHFVQLGIESFSTPVLRRMNKGVTSLQNIYSIYELTRSRVAIYYNILYGFPGDREHEYNAMRMKIKKIRHLAPPSGVFAVEVTRFAPYAVNPSDYYPGAGPARHHYAYELLFSEGFRAGRGLDLDNICYYFENYIEQHYTEELRQVYRWLMEDTGRWRQACVDGEVPPRLYFRDGRDSILFVDERVSEASEQLEFDKTVGDLYSHLIKGPTASNRLQDRMKSRMSPGRLRQALDELESHGLILREGDRYLGIAFPESVYSEPMPWRKEPVLNSEYCVLA